MQISSTVIISLLVVIVMILTLAGFVIGILFLHQKRQIENAAKLEYMTGQYEHELLRSKLEVQEQTLQHISRELHDNVGQYLTLAKLHLNTLSEMIGKDDRKKIDNAIELVTKALEDMRDISRSLSLDLIRGGGLVGAIEDQVERINRTGGFDVKLLQVGAYNYMDEKTEIFIFRIIQEALNNVIRHSGARHITITFDCEQSDKSLALSITDDGKGFQSPTRLNLESNHSFTGGINNMMLRAVLLKADFSLTSGPTEGTTIELTLPLNDAYEYRH